MTDCNVQGKFIMFPLVSWATMFNGPCQLRIAMYKAISSSLSYFLRQLCSITRHLSDGLHSTRHFHRVSLSHLGNYIRLPFSVTECKIQGFFIMFALLSWATTSNRPSQWRTVNIDGFSSLLADDCVTAPFYMMDCKVQLILLSIS